MTTLNIGDKVPEFLLPIADDREISASSLKGHRFIIYFYPKDDTPGCTREAIEFSQKRETFKSMEIEVIGVSKDTLAKHYKFAQKHELNIVLGSDESGEVCEAFGVWVEKKNYGRTYMGIERSTFLIDRAGNIAKIWRKVRVPGHVEAVLEACKAIS